MRVPIHEETVALFPDLGRNRVYYILKKKIQNLFTLFIYGVFSNAANSSDWVAPNDRMVGEL